jgi:hypothetical protein
MYKLFYNSSISITLLRPGLSLEQCLDQANSGNVDEQNRLVRVNWMIQDLHHNPIQKPFLINSRFKVITGDTRLMALRFHPAISHVAAVAQVDDNATLGSGWIQVNDKIELGKLLNIDPVDILTNWDWHERSLDWIEFAYAHTEDHMHDEDQRVRRIRNYLAKYPDTIFDQDWVYSKIDWSLYDH